MLQLKGLGHVPLVVLSKMDLHVPGMQHDPLELTSSFPELQEKLEEVTAASMLSASVLLPKCGMLVQVAV